MKPYKPQLYPSPIALPQRRVGHVQICHRYIGGDVYIVAMREALLRGIRPTKAVLSQPLLVHELVSDEHGTWMTDHPQELNQIGEMLHTVQPIGNVLIGGLGLGVAAKLVSHRADRVVVVERDADVIELCGQRGYEIVNDDIGHYLETTKERFDYYLLDTWQGTNEGEWWDSVFPLRRTIRNRHGKRPVIHCWAEDIMAAQVATSLQRSIEAKRPHWRSKTLIVKTQRDIATFIANVGTREWERKYGTMLPK